VTQLFFDIETRRTENEAVIKRLTDKVKPPGQYKKADSIAQWWATEGVSAKQEAIDRTALDGTYGRLASFAWAEGDGAVKCVSGDDEDGMLSAVAEVFNTKGFDLTVAFNGEFDFRFLYQRFVIRGVKRPFLPGLSRGDYYFDPMREWAGFKGYISQSDLADAMGIAREDSTTGADVGTMIDAGDWAAVEYHNTQDVETLREIYKRMAGA
jgi:DNA polymerase elongation subunit (family B)